MTDPTRRPCDPGADDALGGFDARDPFVDRLRASLAGAPLPPPPSLLRVRRRKIAGVLAAVVLIGVTAAFVSWRALDADDPAWRFTSGDRSDSWRLGEWLEPGAAGAQVRVPDLGKIDLAPGSRARLVSADEREQRLELARGRLDAFIIAPPRVFLVDAPGATAIDMGCAYTLVVGEDGSSTLRVSLGWVELDSRAAIARVPSGATCRIDRSRGPGPPTFADAAPDFSAAVERFARDRGPGSIAELLSLARSRDTLTLWHVLRAAPEPERRAIVRAIGSLSGLDLVEEPLVALDPGALESLWSSLRSSW